MLHDPFFLNKAQSKVYSIFVITWIALIIIMVNIFEVNISSWFKHALVFLVIAGIGVSLLSLIFKSIHSEFMRLTVSQEKNEGLANELTLSKKQLEERNETLQYTMDEIATLGQITKAMTSTMELDNILDIILQGIKRNLKFDRIIVCLVDEKQRVVEGKKAVGIEGIDISGLKISLDEKDDAIVRTVLTARPYIISSFEQASSILRRAGEMMKDGVNTASLSGAAKVFVDLFWGLRNREQAIAAVPLIAKDKVAGVLIADNLHSGKKIEENDLRTLVTFTNQTGLAIENARLYNTERKFSEELKRQVELAKQELEAAQSKLIRSERMSALGEMTAVVAHEVRNPMASVRGSAQRIDQKIAPNDPNKKYTGFIMREIDRLERIVKNMLSYTRQPEPRWKEEDLNLVLDETLSFMNDEISKVDAKIIREFDLSLPAAQVDGALLRQVLLNVIQNALSFLAGREKRELRIGTAMKDGMMEIHVADTGPGIPPDVVPRIFEPFFTTKASGTGLGLAISQRIIESHNGKIEVKTEIDQ
ncbi:MAG: ATP-binding protein, partial [Elusimicrobiota bacterium]